MGSKMVMIRKQINRLSHIVIPFFVARAPKFYSFSKNPERNAVL